MKKPTNSPFNQDMLRAVNDGVISLSEVAGAIKTKLNNTLVSDLPLEAFPLIKKFKTSPHPYENKRLQEVETYIRNTAHLRNNSHKPSLQKSHGKSYLVLGEDDIFEVIEQKGDVYIAYHPIKQIYIVYKFLGEDSDQNTSLLGGLGRIDKTSIDGYYLVSSSYKETFTYLAGLFEEKEVTTEVSYYYIGENGETQYFGDFRRVGDLKKHGNAVFFSGESMDYGTEIIIHNCDKTKIIPAGYETPMKSISGRNLLYVDYAYTSKNAISSLFDLDNMELLFEGAYKFSFKVIFCQNGVRTLENEISWEFHISREGLARLLGKKVARHNARL